MHPGGGGGGVHVAATTHKYKAASPKRSNRWPEAGVLVCAGKGIGVCCSHRVRPAKDGTYATP
jgi:hypothetical protein